MMILLIYVYVSGVISSFSVELNKDKIVNIELESHKSSTRDLVGLQLWRGAFLLAEYLCHASNVVKNQNVLELAAGTGFTSLVAALTAKKVVCTGMYFCGSKSHQSKYVSIFLIFCAHFIVEPGHIIELSLGFQIWGC